MSDRKMATRGRTPLHGEKKQLLTKMVPAVVRRIKAAAAMRDKTASMLFEEISREWLQRNETSASQGKKG